MGSKAPEDSAVHSVPASGHHYCSSGHHYCPAKVSSCWEVAAACPGVACGAIIVIVLLAGTHLHKNNIKISVP